MPVESDSIFHRCVASLRERLHQGYYRRRNLARRRSPQMVWVHIGAPKTGTTLIQNQLLHHPEKLRPQSVGYDGESYWLGVHLAAHSPLPPPELEALRLKWRQQIEARPESAVILSSESLLGDQYEPWKNGAAVARDLRQILAGFEVRIVACTRRQDDLYESLYHQFIKEGGSCSFTEFLERVNPRGFEWDKLLEPFAAQFGREHLRVISFEKAIRDPGGIVEYGFSGLGLPFAFRVTAVPRDNPSYSQKGLEIALRCNPLLSDEERLKLRQFLQAHFPKTAADKFKLFTDAQRQELRIAYAESDRRLAAQYQLA